MPPRNPEHPFATQSSQAVTSDQPVPPEQIPEIGGRKGPDPTRYGDWENNGRCVDF